MSKAPQLQRETRITNLTWIDTERIDYGPCVLVSHSTNFSIGPVVVVLGELAQLLKTSQACWCCQSKVETSEAGLEST
jgi:hypothetical protein